jgi:hypothetical protein
MVGEPVEAETFRMRREKVMVVWIRVLGHLWVLDLTGVDLGSFLYT